MPLNPFLIMVLAGFGAFMAGLAFVAIWSNLEPRNPDPKAVARAAIKAAKRPANDQVTA
ncbi:MAG: hypothetical protein ACXW3D_04120 [Caulobacteraceae bacterium]